MKILYIASRTAETESLALEREITDVQRQISQSSADPVKSVFLPDLTYEELPIALSHYKPDMLHISVHGETAGLSFASEAFEGERRRFVPVTGEALASFFDPDRPPKLIFLNACDSLETARQLAEAGMTAIGTSAPITNRAAVAASRLLYERLVGGRSVAESFTAVDHLVRGMENQATSLHLCAPEAMDVDRLVLNSVPRLAAKLATDAKAIDGKPVDVFLGVVGCPQDTVQIVFFTADPAFDEDEEERELYMSEIVRDRPRRGEVWTDFAWRPEGDFEVAACGITGSGVTYSMSGMLCDSLESYAEKALPPESYRQLLAQAVACLRRNDGGGLESWEPYVPKPRSKSKPKSKAAPKESKVAPSSTGKPRGHDKSPPPR